MQHDFLGLDEYVAEATKTPEDFIKEIKLLPFQEAELTMGAWAMRLKGNHENRNPLTWKLSVFYIYDRQDFIAMTAIEGGDSAEEFEIAQRAYDNGLRRGREYSTECPTGELLEVPAYELVPVSEDQAREVQFFDYKLPLVIGMTDWAEEKMQLMTEGYVKSGAMGGAPVECPKCKQEVFLHAVASFTGKGGFTAIKTETGYQLLESVGFSVDAVDHVHLVCPRDECDYNQCIDLNEFEIDTNNV